MKKVHHRIVTMTLVFQVYQLTVMSILIYVAETEIK